MIREIKYDKDCGLLTSTKKIYVPILNALVEVWVDTDCEEQLQPTEKQITVFENFLNINLNEFQKMTEGIEDYRKLLIQQGKIVCRTKSFQNHKELKFKQIFLPKQNDTKNQYLFVFADTDWKIKYSKYIIELEILFTNNKFELTQEMEGLWTRLEWVSDYDTSENSD